MEYRGQNPNMHCVEALLAAYTVRTLFPQSARSLTCAAFNRSHAATSICFGLIKSPCQSLKGLITRNTAATPAHFDAARPNARVQRLASLSPSHLVWEHFKVKFSCKHTTIGTDLHCRGGIGFPIGTTTRFGFVFARAMRHLHVCVTPCLVCAGKLPRGESF